jgi:hypothetical protein
VTTQDVSPTSPSAPTMRGIATATIVLSNAASSTPTSRAVITVAT